MKTAFKINTTLICWQRVIIMAAVKNAEPIFLIEELSNATMQTISSKYHFSPTHLHLRLLGTCD